LKLWNEQQGRYNGNSGKDYVSQALGKIPEK
jgi:hypothetical protein